MGIVTRSEGKRGCGWRKPGGLYLVASGLGQPCGKLPLALEVCPCCGTGIKPTRGWTWVNGTQLAAAAKCQKSAGFSGSGCGLCPLSMPMGRVGLLWVGEAFYKTAAAFCKEASEQGVSRRIKTVPHGFEVKKTWVWLAHRKAIENPDGSFTAGVFRVFLPQAIEYVVKGTESQEELDRMEKRGITLVKIERKEGNPLFKVLE